MTDKIGQQNGTKMNGDWKKVMFQIYGAGAVFIIGIAVIWWQVLLPNQQAFTRNANTMADQIPVMTKALKTIAEATESTRVFQERVTNDHEKAAKCDADMEASLKRLENALTSGT